ncbi:shikimate kinase [Oryzibacter oryziterrae]|uniref:shikimate kinase n=1 Tax=Oryzibacter oryziterrae TaxID=2766474 RepID=UPI001F403BDF|nr:shikimate kinase [Oryzibacter oryziterrae]
MNDLETLPAGDGPATGEDMAARVLRRLAGRCVVLVGMMGAGKTSVGKRLATRFGVEFADADVEIEAAAKKTIPEIFAEHGEDYFRQGEKRVIARLLRDRCQVIATGGGAYMNAETRKAIHETGISIWLKAEWDLLFDRVKRRANRPLLQTEDPEGTLRRLVEIRYPVYAEADITVLSRDVPHEQMVDAVLAALDAWLEKEANGA